MLWLRWAGWWMVAVSTLGKKGQESQKLMTTQLYSEFKASLGFVGPIYTSECMSSIKRSLKPTYISSSVELNFSGVIIMNIHSLKITTYLLFNVVSWSIYQTYLQTMGKEVRLTDVWLPNSCTTTRSHPVMDDDMRPAYFYFLYACMTGMYHLFCCGEVRKSLFA